MKHSRVLFVSLFLFLFSGIFCRAQVVNVETNAIDWLNLGTMNVEAGVGVSRHVSLHAGVRVNPWTFRRGEPSNRFDDPDGNFERQFQHKRQMYAVGMRYWPWYVYSGWWFGAKAQYSEYDYGGLFKQNREAGDAFGGGLSAGYTYMLSKHWNLDFGLGVWGGYKKYGSYRCVNCGKPVTKSEDYFIVPDEIKVAIMYVF